MIMLNSGAMDEVNDREPSLLVCDSQPNTLLTVGLHTQQTRLHDFGHTPGYAVQSLKQMVVFEARKRERRSVIHYD